MIVFNIYCLCMRKNSPFIEKSPDFPFYETIVPFHAEYSWANRSLFAELNCHKRLISGHVYIIWIGFH